MQDLESLGYFYLGRRYDLARREILAEPILYDSRDLTTHAVCVGMTGSGKTGLCVASARGSGDRRNTRHRDRPQGRPRQSSPHVPRARRERLSPVDRRVRSRPRRAHRRRAGASRGRDVAKRARGVGSGRRAHRAAAICRRHRDLHAGEPCRAPARGARVFGRSPLRDPRRRRGDGRARRRHGRRSSRPPRHRGRPAAQPRARAPRHDSRPRLDRRREPGARRAHSSRAGSAIRARRHVRARVFLSAQRPLRARSRPQQPDRFAALRAVERGRAARRRAPVVHDGGQAASRDRLDLASRRARAHVLRVAAAERGRLVGATTARLAELAGHPLYGRGVRLSAADRISALEKAAPHPAEAGARTRPRASFSPRRTPSTSTTRRCPTPAPGFSDVSRPSATSCACSTAWSRSPAAAR